MRRLVKYTILFTALIYCSSPILSFAGTCWNGGYEGSAPWYIKDGPGGSDSVAYEDVNYCVNTVASEGDTVYVPSGTAIWPSALSISKGVILKGAGIGKTLIKNGNSNYIIIIKPTTPAENPYMEVAGFTFDGNGTSGGGILYIECLDLIYDFNSFRVHHNKFQNVNTGGAVITSGDTYGLIDYNQFAVNNVTVTNSYDMAIYGNENVSWDKHPVKGSLGSADYLYVENNTSTTNKYMIVASGRGARWVYRYNSIDASNMGNMSLWDIHGDTHNRGCIAVEIYENTVTSSTENGFRMLDYRGGTGIIYNNKTQAWAYVSMREEYIDSSCGDKIRDGYLWNNIDSRTGRLHAVGDDSRVKSSSASVLSSDANGCISEDTDWWDDAPNDYQIANESPKNFTYDVLKNRPINSVADDCFWATDTKELYRSDGENNWVLIYTPYVYPHPFSEKSSRPSSPKNLLTQ